MNNQVASSFANYNKLRKRKRVRLYKYLTPPKPEIKQWNCISGSLTEEKYDAITFVNIVQPTNAGVAHGSWELIPFRWPSSGFYEDERIGKKFGLKWIIFRGYATVSSEIAYKCNYKLVLIKSQMNYTDMHDFLENNYFNYESPTTWAEGPHTFDNIDSRRSYARHNFYKLVKNVSNQAQFKTSVRILASGTFTPDGGNPGPRFTTTMGSNPSVTLESQGLSGSDFNNWAFYPINVRLTCNDNIDVSLDHYYLALLTDQPLGHNTSSLGSESSVLATTRQFSFNFFSLGYYLDA